MISIFIVVVVLIGFALFLQRYTANNNQNKEYAYKKRPMLLSQEETSFFHALTNAVGEHGLVFSKVTVSQVLAVTGVRSKKDNHLANSKLVRHCFDFVVCDPRTLEPRVVVEFDDGKPLSKVKVEREKFIIQACKSANLPLIGANIKYSYQVSKLRRLIATHIDLIEVEREVRFCKKCGSPMVVRIASQGDFKGRRFFTCSRQPMCNYTENYNVIYEDEDYEESD